MSNILKVPQQQAIQALIDDRAEFPNRVAGHKTEADEPAWTARCLLCIGAAGQSEKTTR